MHREVAIRGVASTRVGRRNEENQLCVVGTLTIENHVQSQKAVELDLVSFTQQHRPPNRRVLSVLGSWRLCLRGGICHWRRGSRRQGVTGNLRTTQRVEFCVELREGLQQFAILPLDLIYSLAERFDLSGCVGFHSARLFIR